jgi:methylenetetrahydrofolate reductase (NADPH)
LLQHFSAEVTCGDVKSIEAAAAMRPGTEIFIASLPSDAPLRQVATALRLKQAGLTPVPHVVARNIKSARDLDRLLGRLTSEAGVDRVLLLAGDRDVPVGEFESSRALLETGLLDRHGIRRVLFSWYPEGHPRVTAAALIEARIAKLALAERAGLHVTLISQFCFESAPIIATARQLRAEGVTAPLRVGVAGPASRASLLKYAIICGVGASLRALKERPGAGSALGETPEELLLDVARAQAADASLGIEGVHFFTLASLAATLKFVNAHRQ